MKPFLRKSVLFFFVFLLFTGSIGINVFAHFCSLNGTDYSYILPPEACAQEIQPTEKPACCHAEAPVDQSDKQFKNNCCQEAVSTFKISTDFLHHFSTLTWAVIPDQQPAAVYAFATAIAATPRVLGFEKRPPPKPGQEILILHQTFRI